MKRLGFKKSVDLSGIDERVGTSESKIATLERTTSDNRQAIATAQSELNARFDNLSVGGRNLILNSKSRQRQARDNAYNYETYTLTEPLVIGQSYTFTAQVEFIEGLSNVVTIYPYRGGVARHLTVINNQISTTFVATSAQPNSFLIYAGKSGLTNNISINITNAKLERGNVPTDWTPAPEDYTAGLAIYNTTTAQSPNVFVSDTGQLQRSTSSERYKNIISPLVLDDKAYKNAMKLNPIIYRSTAEADKKDWHYYSFSAEQLGQFDKAFTLWRTPTETIIDDNGEITITELEPIAEGINLNAIVAFLHATNVKQGMLIRDLTKRIEFLENQRDK